MVEHNNRTAVSEFTGLPVNTNSEEWRHECEVRAVLEMTKEQRETYFHGNKETGDRGIVLTRGQAVADAIFEDVKRLKATRERAGRFRQR